MNSLTAAMGIARGLLAFIGVMTVLGAEWSTRNCVVMGVALVVAIALSAGADGHRLTPRRIPRPTRYDTAA
ncbi:hypothetical protein [Streptomyces sp. NPDC002467]|uniref:hypothetical protein n=1 Tax=Streptomyces sp. NPDC002467 TaxID=3364647 RepID=UPI003686D4AD